MEDQQLESIFDAIDFSDGMASPSSNLRRCSPSKNGRCIACSVVLVIDGKPGCRGNSANVDHDHKTNLVRGILCWNCNRRLGVLESQPDLNARLLAYAAGGRLIAKAMSDSSGRREPDGQEAASHRSRG